MIKSLGFNLKQKFQEVFSLDLRSLAVFRMAMGLLTIYYFAAQWPEAKLFYSDQGLLPRHFLIQIADSWRISAFMMNGTHLFVHVLFACGILAGLALFLGYFSRTSTFICWFLVQSLQVRNPLIADSAAYAFRLFLFWAMFLPLGAKWSIRQSAFTEKEAQPIADKFSLGTVAYILQFAAIYLTSVAIKWHHPEWRDGSAVYYALNFEYYSKAFDLFLLQFPQLLSLLTWGTLFIETICPLLLLIPFAIPLSRLLALAGFLALQVSFHFCFSIWIFPFVMIIGSIPFIPGTVWQWLEKQTNKFIPRIGKSIKNPPLNAHAAQRFWPADVLQKGFILICLAYVLLFNLSFSQLFPVKIPAALGIFGDVLMLDQYWIMYSPPGRTTGWLQVAGEFSDGVQMDLINKRLASFEKPQPVSSAYKSYLWRRYLFSFYNNKFSRFEERVDYLSWYFCRQWNAKNLSGEYLKHVRVYLMSRLVGPNESPSQDYAYQVGLIRQYSCLGNLEEGKFDSY